MNPSIIQLPKITDVRGNLSFIEGENHIPFSIKRVYWVYDVPGGEDRGSHAFIRNEEFIVALSGAFDVILDDGNETIRYHMNRSYYGLYVPEMLWRTLENFSSHSLALVLASTVYSESDYIRDYEQFKNMLK